MIIVALSIVALARPARAQAYGTVEGADFVYVHDQPSVSVDSRTGGTIAGGQSVMIFCQQTGDGVPGNWGWTDLWDFVFNEQCNCEGYISDGYVNTGSNGLVAPLCKN
jgi:hypothetical protein